MIAGPVLPEFPWWNTMNDRRKIVDGTSRKKWWLPDLNHVMEFSIVGDRVRVTVERYGFGDIIIDHEFSLLSYQTHDLMNQAAVYAEKSFCRTDAVISNLYKSGF